MKTNEDIGYSTFLIMLTVFIGLALLSNFTRAAETQDLKTQIENVEH